MTQQNLDQLFAALDAETAALRSADYDALADLGAQIESLMAQIARHDHPAATLRRIKTTMARNQTQLRAAIAGVGAARDRIATLQHVQQGLSVYDSSGSLRTVPNRRRAVEKKA